MQSIPDYQTSIDRYLVAAFTRGNYKLIGLIKRAEKSVLEQHRRDGGRLNGPINFSMKSIQRLRRNEVIHGAKKKKNIFSKSISASVLFCFTEKKTSLISRSILKHKLLEILFKNKRHFNFSIDRTFIFK